MSGNRVEVRAYDGTIPKSGKQVFQFAGISLCHRSVKIDKSDILVHIDTGAVVRAYPIGTSREKVLDDVAKNIDKLRTLSERPEAFVIGNITSEPIEQSKGILHALPTPFNLSSKDVDELRYDSSCATGSCSSEPKKKHFSLKGKLW